MAFANVPRVTVWVQEFKGRKYLQLQWHDPHTGDSKSRSTETNVEREAEQQRADLEYQLNHGMYSGQSNLTWAKFREMFEREYVPGVRVNTRRNFTATFELFERICRSARLRSVTERTV